MWLQSAAILVLLSSFPLSAQTRRDIIERSEQMSFEKETRPHQSAEIFIGSALQTSLAVLEARGLNSGAIPMQPWSGYFWANLKGGLGFRWQDPAFPQGHWGDARSYVEHRPFTQTATGQLSPAEKYDLAMNIDPRFPGSLTSAEWKLGEQEFNRTGSVLGWQGICHGWAPASVFYPEPKKDVLVQGQLGPILFKIDDIKALGSAFWANGFYRSVYAGFRCRLDEIPRDSEGRVTDPHCFSMNPADWHLILTHMVGELKKPFIIDIDNRSEVWNKPIISYRLEYFDLTNHARTSTRFMNVVKERSRLGNLRFARYRSAEVVHVVGVRSTVVVGYGSTPGEAMPQRRTLVFEYDLELDGSYQILGGEWRSQKHPDFVWRPEFGTTATNLGETRGLNLRSLGDRNWQAAAKRNNQGRIPLKSFVDYLFEESSR